MKPCKWALLFAGLFLWVRPQLAQAQEETKTFVAFSMKVAQARVEEAVRKGEDFRTKQPDLFYLGGITRPWAVVLDTQTGDWILVGEQDQKSSVLTLDDWVAALRARFIHAEKDPGVTIDPRPCEECRKAGKQEGCRHYTRQDVRFFGGIEDTHFGQVCYEADWLMKKIGLALEKLPVEKLKTYYELSVEQHRNAGVANTSVGSRFWFYPIVNRVNVFPEVVLLEKFQMGVFTEVLHAEVDGRPVTDVDQFEHYPSEGFSRSFSENYDAAAEAREVLETLRGLTRLAALAKGLTQVEQKPQVEYFLTGYPREKARTPKEVEVLKVENREVGFGISGGAELMALAMRLKGGDTSALKELVWEARKAAGAEALSWGFEMDMAGGQLKGVSLPPGLADPDQIAPLFHQAVFIQEKKRYDAAIECYDKVLEMDPRLAEVWNNKGAALGKLGRYEESLECFDRTLEINSRLAEAWANKARSLGNLDRYEEVLMCLDRALEINCADVNIWLFKAQTLYVLDQPVAMLTYCNRALEIEPSHAEAWAWKGLALCRLERYQDALKCCERALEVNHHCGEVYYCKGVALYCLARDLEAREAFQQAVALGVADALHSIDALDMDAWRRRSVWQW